MNDSVPSQSKFNVYSAITESIVESIKAGAGTFTMPWHGSGAAGRPQNASTEARYRGINILALWVAAVRRDFPTGYWASFKQWQRLGAHVRKGEHGATIVFYKEIEPDPSNEQDDRPRLMGRASRVFNAAQVEGWSAPELDTPSRISPIEAVEAFASATDAVIRHGGAVAQYCCSEDIIEMPDHNRFHGSKTSTPTETYYSTLLHELTHWSGAPHRLDRRFEDRFGDKEHAFEELIAELGAAFLCSSLGITNEPRPDHAAYVAHWLEILDHDHRAVFTAAGKAQEAVGYLAQLAALKLGPLSAFA
jgi:antirestriction protein ArdC